MELLLSARSDQIVIVAQAIAAQAPRAKVWKWSPYLFTLLRKFDVEFYNKLRNDRGRPVGSLQYRHPPNSRNCPNLETVNRVMANIISRTFLDGVYRVCPVRPPGGRREKYFFRGGQDSTAQHSTTQHNTSQYNTTQRNTTPRHATLPLTHTSFHGRSNHLPR